MSLNCPECQSEFSPSQTFLFLRLASIRCGSCGQQVALNSTGRMRLIVPIFLGFLVGILFGILLGYKLVVLGAVFLGALAGMIGAWNGGKLNAVEGK